jgi:hypothetical protein
MTQFNRNSARPRAALCAAKRTNAGQSRRRSGAKQEISRHLGCEFVVIRLRALRRDTRG